MRAAAIAAAVLIAGCAAPETIDEPPIQHAKVIGHTCQRGRLSSIRMHIQATRGAILLVDIDPGVCDIRSDT